MVAVWHERRFHHVIRAAVEYLVVVPWPTVVIRANSRITRCAQRITGIEPAYKIHVQFFVLVKEPLRDIGCRITILELDIRTVFLHKLVVNRDKRGVGFLVRGDSHSLANTDRDTFFANEEEALDVKRGQYLEERFVIVLIHAEVDVVYLIGIVIRTFWFHIERRHTPYVLYVAVVGYIVSSVVGLADNLPGFFIVGDVDAHLVVLVHAFGYTVD